jgi:hypothetical protein
MAGQTYTLNFQNDSSNAGDVCVYQTLPNLAQQDVMSLAWFAEYNYPTTAVQFQWEIDYSFVWDQTGPLIPGVVFVASQTWPADLANSNQVTLTYDQAYTFTNQTAGGSSGNLYITEDRTVPLNDAAVGIAMSGAGTFVQQAQPNLNLVFTPTPTYWITFGNYTQGQVMDIESITNSAQIQFGPNVYAMSAVLNADNTWTVSPTT